MKSQGITLVTCRDMDEGRQRAIDAFRESGEDDVSVVDAIGDMTKRSLFGPEPMIACLSDKESVGAVAELDLASYDSGLIIVTTCNRNARQVKSLMERVRAVGGIVEKETDASADIDSLDVAPDIRAFLHSYTLDDYAMISQTISEVRAMPESERHALTVDDIIARLPQRPGSIPPWGTGYGRSRTPGLDELVIARRRDEALRMMERIMDGGTPAIMTATWLRNQWTQGFELFEMISSGMPDGDAAHALGLPDPKYRKSGQKDPATGKSGYPTYRKISDYSRIGEDRLIRNMTVLTNVDRMLKGGGRGRGLSQRNMMIRMVANLCD